MAAGCSKQVLYWETKSAQGRAQRTCKWSSGKKEVSCLAFSASRQLLAAGSYDATVRLWEVDNKLRFGNDMKGPMKKVHSVVFCPNNLCLAVGSADGNVHLWDALTQAHLIKLQCSSQAEAVLSLAISPAGLLASGTSSGKIFLWDSEACRKICELDATVDRQDGAVVRSSDSPDRTSRMSASNSRLSISGLMSGSRRSASGSRSGSGSRRSFLEPRIEPLLGHDHFAVNSLAFSPDGSILASGAADRRTVLWEI